MIKFILLFFTFILSLTTFGQVNFSSLPENKQLIARDLSTNQGTINISGSVNNGPYFDLAYSNWKSGEPITILNLKMLLKCLGTQQY